MNKELEQIIESEAKNSSLLSRRKFLHMGIIGTSVLAASGCVAGIANRNKIDITRKTITIPNLPQSFKGTTISLASDIHSGPYMSEEELRHIVKTINSLGSDMILLPGDFVTSNRNEVEGIAETFHELSAPMGVFATTGNHEYYVDVDLVCDVLDESKIKVLRNDNHIFEKNGEKLYLLGVDDMDADGIKGHLDGKESEHVSAVFKGVPDTAATILMNHKPYRFDEYSHMNVGLMVSGHTHGGQIVFARVFDTTLSFSRVASKYVEGLYTHENDKRISQMYVSRGLGTVALPMRFNCPPEITQITLA
ncbi:MAG TPA: metallophosphoesterase [Candidatus Kapabacteria bacterium]